MMTVLITFPCLHSKKENQGNATKAKPKACSRAKPQSRLPLPQAGKQQRKQRCRIAKYILIALLCKQNI